MDRNFFSHSIFIERLISEVIVGFCNRSVCQFAILINVFCIPTGTLQPVRDASIQLGIIFQVLQPFLFICK